MDRLVTLVTMWWGGYPATMSRIGKLAWIASKEQPIPEGSAGEMLWVKLGWASFCWTWHPNAGVWAAEGWREDADMESVAPGASRRDMSWARP